MKINAITLTCFRCWDTLVLKDFTKYNSIIGENNSGKSSILIGIFDSLVLSSLSSEKIQHKRISARITLEIILSREDIDHIVSKLDEQMGDIDGHMLDHIISTSHQWGRFIWETIVMVKNNAKLSPVNNSNQLFYLDNVETIRDKTTHKQYERSIADLFQNTNIASHLVDIIVKYVPEQIIHIQARRAIEKEETSVSYSFSPIFKGGTLKRILHDAKNSDDNRRVQGYKRFQEVVKDWSFIPGKPDITARAGDEVKLVFWKDDKTAIPIEEVGDGIKEAIIIAGVCLTYPEKIFLIEEPELHLHPRALRELRYLLKYEIEGQVFISTHSPTFINEMDEESSIIKVLKKGKKLQAIPIYNRDELNKFKQEFGLLNSDFLFENSLIFVEGYSDKLTFQNWFEVLFPSNLSVRFIAVGGEKEIKPALILSMMLQLQQHFAIFSILDSDRIDPEERKNKILDNLKGRHPQLVETIGEESIKEYVYVLKKSKLESYLVKAPRVIAEWLDVDQKQIVNTLNELKGSSDKKLSFLAKKHGVGFRKVRDLSRLASIMKKEEIDPEIQRLLTFIHSFNKDTVKPV